VKKLLTAFGLLCVCGSAAAQTVITAEPAAHDYKFVWSDDSAVFKMTDGSITVRCQYGESKNGVDDDAKPYTSSMFKCDNGGLIALKQIKGTNDSTLILADENGKLMSQDKVSVTKNTY